MTEVSFCYWLWHTRMDSFALMTNVYYGAIGFAALLNLAYVGAAVMTVTLTVAAAVSKDTTPSLAGLI